MDGRRFDGIARAVAEGGLPRRRALALLVGAFAAGRLTPAAAQDAGTPAADGGAAQTTFPAGFTDCPGVGCVDLQADLQNCGACGAVCESQLVPVRCNAGVCERADCAVGQEYCGAVDGCRDLQTDPEHCGRCGNSCGGQTCANGRCGSCAEGQTVCDGICVDLCCNNDHCGACGNACMNGRTCFEAVCDCPSGQCGQGGGGVTTPPNTGVGTDPSSAPVVAAVLAGAAVVAGWLGLRERSPREG